MTTTLGKLTPPQERALSKVALVQHDFARDGQFNDNLKALSWLVVQLEEMYLAYEMLRLPYDARLDEEGQLSLRIHCNTKMYRYVTISCAPWPGYAQMFIELFFTLTDYSSNTVVEDLHLIFNPQVSTAAALARHLKHLGVIAEAPWS
jgi:hypothetical protein